MAREMLGTDQVETIVKNGLLDKKQWSQQTVCVSTPFSRCTAKDKEDKRELIYYYNTEKNAVIIPNALTVDNSNDAGIFDPSYADAVAAIMQQLNNPESRPSFSVTLIGKGSTERHYVACYEDHDKKRVMIDSKLSNADLFLGSSNSPTRFEKFKGGVIALFKTVFFNRFSFLKNKPITSTFLSQPIDVLRRGTQGFFDGISCGYHSAGTVLAMANYISDSEYKVTTELMKTHIAEQSNLDVQAEEYLKSKIENNQVSNRTVLSSTASTVTTLKENCPPKQQGDSPDPSPELVSAQPSAFLDEKQAKQVQVEATREDDENITRALQEEERRFLP